MRIPIWITILYPFTKSYLGLGQFDPINWFEPLSVIACSVQSNEASISSLKALRLKRHLEHTWSIFLFRF